MLARIKDIPVGTQVESTFQFIEKMKWKGIWKFHPIQTANPEEWEGWWRIAFPDPSGGCVYHISWLEEVTDSELLDDNKEKMKSVRSSKVNFEKYDDE